MGKGATLWGTYTTPSLRYALILHESITLHLFISLVLLLGLEFLTVRIYPSRNNCWLQKNILTL